MAASEKARQTNTSIVGAMQLAGLVGSTQRAQYGSELSASTERQLDNRTGWRPPRPSGYTPEYFAATAQ